jgi:hypothetical protein
MKKLKPHAVDWAQIGRFLASANKKLASAHKILASDEEACLQQAYEAMLKAFLGFMFTHGFLVRSQPGTTSPSSILSGHASTRNMQGCWSSSISLTSAICSNDFARSHQKLARGRETGEQGDNG